jgi:hypothetical protein
MPAFIVKQPNGLLARIEQKLDELGVRRKARRRGERARLGTVAERAADGVAYRPTEMQIARARKALGVR